MEKVDRLSGGSDDCVAAMKMVGRERWWMRFGSNNSVDEVFFFFSVESSENGWDKGLVKIWKIKNPGII